MTSGRLGSLGCHSCYLCLALAFGADVDKTSSCKGPEGTYFWHIAYHFSSFLCLASEIEGLGFGFGPLYGLMVPMNVSVYHNQDQNSGSSHYGQMFSRGDYQPSTGSSHTCGVADSTPGPGTPYTPGEPKNKRKKKESELRLLN